MFSIFYWLYIVYLYCTTVFEYLCGSNTPSYLPCSLMGAQQIWYVAPHFILTGGSGRSGRRQVSGQTLPLSWCGWSGTPCTSVSWVRFQSTSHPAGRTHPSVLASLLSSSPSVLIGECHLFPQIANHRFHYFIH